MECINCHESGHRMAVNSPPLCKPCWQRARNRPGWSPTGRTLPSPNLGHGLVLTRESVLARVQVVGDCWHWPKVDKRTGYSTMLRASYEAFVGPIPSGVWIDHTCHNADRTCVGGTSCLHRRCVNPAHLEAVTPRENALRSRLTQASINAAKTHCPQGHEYTPENTYRQGGVGRGPGRVCKACAAAAGLRRYYARKTAAVA